MSESALKHTDHLSKVIGPRGSTTPKEKEAHDYAQKILSDLGCDPRAEAFQSSPSAYLPFILALGVVLLAEAIFYFTGPTPNAPVGALAAFALGLLVTVSAVLELMVRDNPLRWFLPVGDSRNVVGVTPAANEPRRRVAVMAHVDSHRTPLFWRTPNTYKVYRAITALGLIGLLALDVIFLISVFAPNAGLRTISLIPAAIIGLAWLMVLQAHNTPFTAGANDNASGVGVLLALAERAQREPLPNTEVWWVASGCEEVGVYGSADFVRRHKAELESSGLIAIDSVAGKETDLVYLHQEGLLIPKTYPASVLARADQIARERPELKAHAFKGTTAYTDGFPALEAGLPCLALLNYTRDGWIPNWHNPTDVFANVDADAVDRAERFVWELLKALDTPVPENEQEVSSA